MKREVKVQKSKVKSSPLAPSPVNTSANGGGWGPFARAALALLVLLHASPLVAQHVHGDAPPAAVPAAPASGERTILYWYDPMHPQFRSEKPGPAPDCGMEMVPMYADEVAAQQNLPAGAVRISPLKQQLTGIRTTAVARQTLTKTIRTVGIVRANNQGQQVETVPLTAR